MAQLRRHLFLKTALGILAGILLCICPSFAAESVVALPASGANIVVTGDIMCLASQLSAAKVSGGWDFHYVFSMIQPILQNADFAIGNLETPVAGAEKGVTAYNQAGNPILNAPEEFVDAVADAGFDMVVTANNHSFDKGAYGLKNTLRLLNEKGIYHAGTYTSYYMQDNTPIVRINDISVAVLSYTQFVNTGTEAYKNSGESYSLNLIDVEAIHSDIEAVRARHADFVIVYVHWGTENTRTLTKYQQETAKAIAEAGADVIIGSHPHVVQAVQFLPVLDESGGEKQVLVAYSLGNLVSSMPREINKDSLILNLSIERAEDGSMCLKEASYLCTTTASLKGKGFAILPSRLCIEKKISASTMKASIARTIEAVGGEINETALFSFVTPDDFT